MENGNEPATKADLQALKADLENLGVRIDGRFHGFEHRVEELIKESETRLLRAFYDFAESNQKRLTEAERGGAGLTERLGIVERRVTEIEKRLHLPPSSNDAPRQ